MGVLVGCGDDTTSSKDPVDNPNNQAGDETAPTVSISSPADGDTLAEAVTVTVDAADDTAVTEVVLSVDGAEQTRLSAAPYQWQWDITQLAEGDHQLVAEAFDAAGNSASDSVTVTYSTDGVPSVSITEPADGAFVTGMVDVKAEASDDDAVVAVEFLVGGGRLAEDTTGPFSAQWDTTESADGPVTLRVRATDTADQQVTSEIDVIVDNAAPELTIAEPNSLDLYGDTVPFRATVSDGTEVASVEFIIDDGAETVTVDQAPWETSFDASALASGQHDLKVVATDAVGLTSEATTVFQIDRAPSVSFTNPTQGGAVDGPIDVRVDAADDFGLQSVVLLVDGAPVGTFDQSGAYAWRPATTGDVTLQATATDSSGQTASASVDVSVSSFCGDGTVDSGEVCDDGNNTGGDGCSADCTSTEVCGNGVVDSAAGEACDDGNTVGGDGCAGDCSSLETCGDGVIDGGEVCDDGNTVGGDGCAANCASDETCGNSVVDTAAGEVCDDGNTTGGDGCAADCASAEVCGNGVVDTAAGEVCDDGNTTAGDGCSADCTSAEVCGNGFIDAAAGEVCDDGNTTGGDGCSADCTSNEVCGNSVVDAAAGEVCDDGNTVGGDGCAANCASDETCGNNVIDTAVGEICDDGNTNDGDGCAANCGSDETCGNNIVDTAVGEVCDDGNTRGGDGCAADCLSETVIYSGCTADADCASHQTCNTSLGRCEDTRPTCQSDADCAGGFCVDGFCAADCTGTGSCADAAFTCEDLEDGNRACIALCDRGSTYGACSPDTQCIPYYGEERGLCRPVGGKKLGETCSDDYTLDDCYAGNTCIERRGQLECRPICYLADGASSCGSGDFCYELFTDTVGTSSDQSAGVCLDDCGGIGNTDLSVCDAGEGCRPLDDQHGVCLPEGTVDEGGTCRFDGTAHCKANMFCRESGPGAATGNATEGTCTLFCDPTTTANACDGPNEVCGGGSATLGVCLESCDPEAAATGNGCSAAFPRCVPDSGIYSQPVDGVCAVSGTITSGSTCNLEEPTNCNPDDICVDETDVYGGAGTGSGVCSDYCTYPDFDDTTTRCPSGEVCAGRFFEARLGFCTSNTTSTTLTQGATCIGEDGLWCGDGLLCGDWNSDGSATCEYPCVVGAPGACPTGQSCLGVNASGDFGYCQ